SLMAIGSRQVSAGAQLTVAMAAAIPNARGRRLLAPAVPALQVFLIFIECTLAFHLTRVDPTEQRGAHGVRGCASPAGRAGSSLPGSTAGGGVVTDVDDGAGGACGATCGLFEVAAGFDGVPRGAFALHGGAGSFDAFSVLSRRAFSRSLERAMTSATPAAE